MKANEAPEKIYLHIRPNKEIGSTWHGNKIIDTDIEYTRTDAFIEKAVKWLKENGGCYWMDDYDLPTDDLVNDFKNYMRGE